MDRQIVYVGQIPLDTDELNTNKSIYISVAKLAGGVLGLTQILNGFNCTATAPAGMTVNVALGEVYSLQQVDTSAYGSLTTDSNQIMKQGIVLGTTNLSAPAPVTPGNSINYLVQVGFLEQDTNSVVLPYYNSADINAPFSGPGNSGASQNTKRQDTATVSIKAGVSAPTGTQTTPNPDTGYTGAWVVTVAYGQTTITSGNISQYSAASFITETLTQKISQPTADLRYTQITRVQNGYYWAATDTGTANTYVASLSPALTTYTVGQIAIVLISNTNSGASTLNLNGLGAKNILRTNGATPFAGDLVSGMIAYLVYDGTNFQILNPVIQGITASQIQNGGLLYAADTGSVNAVVVALSPVVSAYVAGMKFSVLIANTNTSSSSLNLNSLGTKSIKLTNGASISPGDLIAGQIADFEYDGTNIQLLNPGTWASQIQVQNGSLVYAVDGGSANSYTASISPSISAYTTGMKVNIKISNTNTGNSTLNLNSLGAKNIKLLNGNNPAAGDIVSGQYAEFGYDGTNMQLLNPASSPSQLQVQAGTILYAASTSAANTYTATLSPSPSTIPTGMQIRINFTNANTSSATLNINGLGAKSILREDGSALVAGDINAGTIVDLEYNGTHWRLTGTKIWQFGNTQSSNGFTKLPNGLIMQWGNCTLPASGVTESQVAVTFPLAFPTAVFSITTSYNGASGGGGPAHLFNHMSTAYNTVTVSGFNFYGDTGTSGGTNFSQTVACSWMAIGN